MGSVYRADPIFVYSDIVCRSWIQTQCLIDAIAQLFHEVKLSTEVVK